MKNDLMSKEKVNLNELLVIRPIDEKLSNINESYELCVDNEASLNKVNSAINNGGNENRISKQNHSWTRVGNQFFISKIPNQSAIPSGLYSIKYSERDGLFFEAQTANLDEIFLLPDASVDKVVEDCIKFWDNRERYEEYSIVYKRGILIHGVPGGGKSSLINLLCNEIISKHNGVVLNVENINHFIPMVRSLRFLEPDKPILALIEDLDSFLEYNSTKDFLNLLDGNLQIDNIIYLATTNYLNRIEERVRNRPSRFDVLIEIGMPSDDVRRFFINRKLKQKDLLELTPEGVEKWVKDTNGMSFSHLKELIVSVIVMQNDYDETIKRLKEMNSLQFEKPKY